MKKFTSLLLIVMMVMSLSVIAVNAAATTIEGTDITWEIVDGVMTINGTGAMPDYRGVEDTRPWLDQLDTVTKVVVKSGITHVGSSSFTRAAALEEVVLEEGVQTVGMDAFSYNGTLTTVSFPASLTELKQGVFYSCSNIATVNYPKTQDAFKANVTRANYNDDYIFGAVWNGGADLVWPETITVAPKYVAAGIENWRGGTWFLLGPTFSNETLDVLKTKIAEGTYSVKFVITDETDGTVYTISNYAFDHVDEGWANTEIDTANKLVRLCASDYGIPVTVGHKYTVTGEITEGETVKYTIASAEGAYEATEDNITGKAASGPAADFVPPHSYDKDEPVVPPVEPPVDPGEQPDTGDATVYAIVFAVVALMGMGVVVTKKVRA